MATLTITKHNANNTFKLTLPNDDYKTLAGYLRDPFVHTLVIEDMNLSSLDISLFFKAKISILSFNKCILSQNMDNSSLIDFVKNKTQIKQELIDVMNVLLKISSGNPFNECVSTLVANEKLAYTSLSWDSFHDVYLLLIKHLLVDRNAHLSKLMIDGVDVSPFGVKINKIIQNAIAFRQTKNQQFSFETELSNILKFFNLLKIDEAHAKKTDINNNDDYMEIDGGNPPAPTNSPIEKMLNDITFDNDESEDDDLTTQIDPDSNEETEIPPSESAMTPEMDMLFNNFLNSLKLEECENIEPAPTPIPREPFYNGDSYASSLNFQPRSAMLNQPEGEVTDHAKKQRIQ